MSRRPRGLAADALLANGLHDLPPETTKQRWTRLHRRILAAGRAPALTLEGCELQARMLDSGVMQPAPPNPEGARIRANDDRQRAEFHEARHASEADEAVEYRADLLQRAREEHRNWTERSVSGSDAFQFRDDETAEDS